MKNNNSIKSIILSLYIFITFMSSIIVALINNSNLWISILIILQFVLFLIISQIFNKKNIYFIHLIIVLLIISIILLIKLNPQLIYNLITNNGKININVITLNISIIALSIICILLILDSTNKLIKLLKCLKIIKVEITDYDSEEKLHKTFYYPIYKYVYNDKYIEKKGKILYLEDLKRNTYLIINKNNSLTLNKKDYIHLLINIIVLVIGIFILTIVIRNYF